MACTNCSQTKTVITPCSTGCTTTINTDCVIYDDEPLCFEDSDVDNGDKRVLTDLLKLIPCIDSVDRESKIIEFNSDGETGNGDSYTIVEEDTTKILLLKFTDNGESGMFENTIILPESSEFINKEIIIKDISTVGDSQTTIVNHVFNSQIQYSWNPLLSSNEFDELADSKHKVLRLKLIKVSALSYQWVVVSNASSGSQGEIETWLPTFSNDWTEALGYPVRVHKLGNEIKMSGVVIDGENSTVMFTLPSDMRPSYNLSFYAVCTDPNSNGWAEIIITTSGLVSVGANGISGGINVDEGGVSLAGVNYYIT